MEGTTAFRERSQQKTQETYLSGHQPNKTTGTELENYSCARQARTNKEAKTPKGSLHGALNNSVFSQNKHTILRKGGKEKILGECGEKES